MIKKISIAVLVLILVVALVFSLKYTLRYMHWSTKADGYPGLYKQQTMYSFTPAGPFLTEAAWKSLGLDAGNDGDIPNWPDANEVSFTKLNDSIWIRVSLHNNIDINEPMVSIAIEEVDGNEWYGTVDFNYGGIISAGYYRKQGEYFGYNFSPDETGICSFKYDLPSNCYFLGISSEKLRQYKGRNCVVSVGMKGLWNDDIESLLSIDSLLK